MPIHTPRRSAGASAFTANSLATNMPVRAQLKMPRSGHHQRRSEDVAAKPRSDTIAVTSATSMKRCMPNHLVRAGTKGAKTSVDSPATAMPVPLAPAE